MGHPQAPDASVALRILSDSKCSAKHRKVTLFRFTVWGKIYAALCIALALLFAALSLSGLINETQHVLGGPADHSHSILSELTIEQDHAADHHAAQHDDDGPANDLPGAHHHHWDGSSGTLLLGLCVLSLATAMRSHHDRKPEPALFGGSISAFERPPKSDLSSV